MSGAPYLVVEGPDDLYFIGELMKRLGRELPKPPKVVLGEPELKHHSGLEGLKAQVPIYLVGDRQPVGFVVDADVEEGGVSGLQRRWTALRNLIDSVTMPHECPPDGWVGKSDSRRGSFDIGVYIWPNCVDDGTLEDLIVAAGSGQASLKAYALTASQHAYDHEGAQFKKTHMSKAHALTWMAWQEDPGQAYGTAVKAGIIDRSHPDIQKFVTWFNKLFPPPV